ncbi:MAG: PrsW family glutamic-type intramembrane protease [bacterium]|nr:PrsW family glutamic-type intramembrane protease [bacterium]
MNRILIFSFGIAAAFSALVFQIMATIVFPALENSTSLEKIGAFMFVTIFIEEFVKFILLWKISQNSKTQKNIFWSSIILGSGFATAEIFLNFLNNNPSDTNLFFSYLGLFLLHILTSSVYSLYLSKKKNLAIWSTLAIFGFGYFLHFLFNFFVYSSINPLSLDCALIIFILLTCYLNKKA